MSVEGTAEQLRLGNLNLKMDAIGRTGKKLKDQSMLNIINNRHIIITSDDLEKMPEPVMPNMPGGVGSAPNEGGMSSNNRNEKREEELVRERNTGKPVGV